MTTPKNKPTPHSKEFVIARSFNAPRELVWKAWTDTEHLKNWWGPKGFSVSVAKLDLRAGGTFLYRLTSPDGHEMWGKFAYREITPPERLVFINSFSDKDGGVTRHPLHQTWPLQMLSTVDFTERNGKTTVTVKWVALAPTDEERRTFEQGFDSMTQGWTGTFDRLENYFSQLEPSDREIVLSRVFDAPRDLVWEVWTNPKHVANWWGPRGFTTTIKKMDVRPGGVWRHVMRGPDGTEYANKSTFKEIVKPERIVMSHGGARKGGRGVRFTATWTFEALGGRTKVTLRSVFPSAQERDRVVKEFNAVEGGKQTLARLGEYLAKQ